MSTIKIVWKYLTGGFDGVVTYALDIGMNALKGLDSSKKEKIIAVFNTMSKVISVLDAAKWLCPTKWQSAYAKTINAVAMTADGMKDLELTKSEFDSLVGLYTSAYIAWQSEDDETCVD